MSHTRCRDHNLLDARSLGAKCYIQRVTTLRHRDTLLLGGITQHLHHDITLALLHSEAIATLRIGGSAIGSATDVYRSIGKRITLVVGDNTLDERGAWWLGGANRLSNEHRAYYIYKV